ncbi:cobalt-zinc-cadmium resistance protein CzcA [Klebsiella pneumoniae]|nr:cobalt-zinc-cadmium resistance protein CzcA [Klebsiella pneumoniae]
MGFWIRGRIPAESSNPLNRFLIRIYHPLLLKVLHWPKDYPADCAPVDPDGCLAA